MTREQVLDILSERLAPVLAEAGFTWRQTDESFIRKIPAGRQSLGIALRKYGLAHVVSLVICIRLEEAERLFHLFSGVPREYQEEGDTTITPLSYFAPSGDFRIESETDVIEFSGVLAQLFKVQLLPFLDRHQDAISLHESVNLSVPSIDISQPPAGPMQSIILAYLSRSSDYSAIVSRRRSEMSLLPTESNPFNNLDKYLRHLGAANTNA